MGIPTPETVLQDALGTAGASGIDLDAALLILAPLWGFTAAEQADRLRLRFAVVAALNALRAPAFHRRCVVP